MADEKNVVKGKEEKVTFFTKVANFFKKLPTAIARPFKNMWHELRKVTWPSRPDVIKYSLIVLVFLVFMGVVIALLDTGSLELVKAITPPDKETEELRAQYLAQFPEGSHYDENNNVVLPDGYVFDSNYNVIDIQAVLDTLPEGSYFDKENGQFVLAEGYTYDAYGNVITNEQAEQLKDYPAGSYYGEDGTVILPDGYDYDENGQVIEVQPEEDTSSDVNSEESTEVEDTGVAEEPAPEEGEVSSENE